MIIENDGLHQQLEDVVENEESDVRLEKQVDGSIAVTDYTTHEVLIEAQKTNRKQEEEKCCDNEELEYTDRTVDGLEIVETYECVNCSKEVNYHYTNPEKEVEQ